MMLEQNTVTRGYIDDYLTANKVVLQPIIAMRTPIIRQLAMTTLDIGAFRLVVRRGLYHKERLTAELMDFFWKPMKTRVGRRAFLHFADCLNNRHLVEIEGDLCRLATPTHIMRGDADVYLSAAISEKLQHDIPRSKLTRIATGGHFIQEDEPEMVAQEILRFYRRAATACFSFSTGQGAKTGWRPCSFSSIRSLL